VKRWIVVAVLLFVPACSNAPSKEQCEKLLNHSIDLELRDSATALPDRAAQVKSLTDMARDEFMRQCLDEMPQPRVACALKAATKDELLSCDETP
jgi:hypothetical protein